MAFGIIFYGKSKTDQRINEMSGPVCVLVVPRWEKSRNANALLGWVEKAYRFDIRKKLNVV